MVRPNDLEKDWCDMACATFAETPAPSLCDREPEHNSTGLAFHRLLAWLDEGHESYGERYVEMRQRLIRYFDRRGRPFPDELADDTLHRITRILERDGSVDVAPPARYCYVVARFVMLEDVRREQRDNNYRASQYNDFEARGWSDESLEGSEIHHREERLNCLDACLQTLSADQRDLIVEYYREVGESKIAHRRKMAKRLGISSNALTIRASRIRSVLETRMSASFKTETASPLEARA